MRKTLLAFLCTLCLGIFSTTSFAQLSAGDVAPNFSFVDLNGTEHELYDYLDQGYTVIFDISATWCGPCWSFHQAGSLDNLYINHGPAGMPGVSVNTTDDIMVFWLEGDVSTSVDAMYGNAQGGEPPTQGDWVTGHPFPIGNLPNTDILAAYGLTGFPNAWTVCPNRIIQRYYAGYSSSSMSATAMYNEAGNCEAASQDVQPAILAYTGLTTSCDDIPVSVTIQNMGLTEMTQATISVTDESGDNVLPDFEWTGSLGTYATEEVQLGIVSVSDETDITISIVSDADASATDDVEVTLVPAPLVGVELDVEVRTDNYGAETYWRIINDAGDLIAQGGNQAVGTNGGAQGPNPVGEGTYQNNTTYNQTVVVPAGVACYTFEIYDHWGDGVCCDYGQGSYSVTDVATQEVIFSGGEFGADEKKNMNAGVVSTSNIDLVRDIRVFPNPTNGEVNLEFTLVENAQTTVQVFDITGRVVLSENFGTLSEGFSRREMRFDGLPQGVYVLNLVAGDASTSMRVVLTR
jgi:hypothetical protein